MRNRNVHRIERSAGDHHAIFAHASAVIAHVDVFHQQHVVAGKVRAGGSKIARPFGQREMLTRMVSRRAHEQRKT